MGNYDGQSRKIIKIDIENKIRLFIEMKAPFPYSLLRPTSACVVVLLLYGMTFGNGFIVKDYFRLSWYVLALISLIIINDISSKSKRLFANLYNKKILLLGTEKEKLKFTKFLDNYSSWLTNKYGNVLGLFFVVGLIVPTYPVIYWLTTGESTFPLLIHWFNYFGVVNFVIIDILLAYPVGLAYWQFCVSAIFLEKFGREYKLKAQFMDPDNSGGLRSIGNICFSNSLVILIPSIVLSGWIIISKFPGYEVFGWWTTYLQYVLFLLVILSFFVFFRPLLAIHRQMKTQRDTFVSEIENMGWMIEKRYGNFHKKIVNMSAADLNTEVDTIDKLIKFYQSNLRAPSWPFDKTIFFKFITSVLFPLLTTLGITESVVKFVSSILLNL